MQDKEFPTSLIYTKLHRSPLKVGMVKRPRLTRWLDQRRRQPLTLGEGLQPGTSVIVAVVEHTWVSLVEEALAEDGDKAGSLVIDETGACGDRFIATEDGFAVEEMVVTENEIVDTLIVGVLDDEEGEET